MQHLWFALMVGTGCGPGVIVTNPADGKDDTGAETDTSDTTYSGDTADAYDTSVDPTLAREVFPSTVIIVGDNPTGITFLEGDVNDDIRDDLVVGVPSETEPGSVYLFSGPIRTSTDTEAATTRFVGFTNGDRVGKSMAYGDFNADGNKDIAIGGGAPDEQGFVVVRSGPFVAGDLPLSTATILTGEVNPDGFGNALAVGDLNYDGIDDVIVGAPWSENGRVDLYLGTTSGIPEDPYVGMVSGSSDEAYGSTLLAADFDADGQDDLVVGAVTGIGTKDSSGIVYCTFTPMDSREGVSVKGEDSGDLTGTSIAVADLDDDGHHDLLIGAPKNDRAGLNAGTVYLVRGPLTEDVSLAQADAIIVGDQVGAEVGTSISPASDMDGDGRLDIVIGAPYYDEVDYVNSGRAYIVSGPISGWMSVAEAMFIRGTTTNGKLGSTVLGDTELTGDDHADVLLAAPWANDAIVIWNGL